MRDGYREEAATDPFAGLSLRVRKTQKRHKEGKAMAKNAKTTASGSDAGQTVPASAVFMELPPDQIIVEKQIRSEIDPEEESFQALKASIEKAGLLEPPLVMKCDDGYHLLSGERRLRACRELGFATIPVRVLENIIGPADVISIQLIENLLRKDLNPIDQAGACVSFFEANQEGITLDEIIGSLTTYEMTPERINSTFAENISAIANYTGKSNRSLINCLTLLRLPEEVQNGLKTEAVSPSIGYVFAANLECPRFMEVYQAFLNNPLTVRALQDRFRQYKDAAKGGQTATAAKKPFQRLSASMKSTRAVIEKNAATYVKADIELLLTEVEALQAFLKEKLLTAPEGEATNPPETAASGSASKKTTTKAKTATATTKTTPKKKAVVA
jgi:ParB family transcriptional regulator, chromosome partitioning protein